VMALCPISEYRELSSCSSSPRSESRSRMVSPRLDLVVVGRS
jgi:hypothetical protein